MWTPIATQRNRNPQNSALIQGKPTLTTCTGNITVINPVVTSKGKFPKSADNKFVQGTRKGTSQRTEKACPEPEYLEENTLDTAVDGKKLREINPLCHSHPNSTETSNPRTGRLWIKFFSSTNSSKTCFNGAWTTRGSTWHPTGQNLEQVPEDLSSRGRLQRTYGNHQRLESHQEVQTPGGEGKQDKGESSHYPSYRRTTHPDRAYSNYFRLTRSRPNQIYSGFTPFRNQEISGQESSLFTIPGSFQEKTRIQGQKKTTFNQRMRESDPMIQKLLDLVKEVRKNQK
ncbi:hypothetical protein O181_014256 [Austropuccinia psidii MF-1]|uniref:Uncharacterized protein n=1 Tax=Austropuccinia psidii MF-1 TaxID=1389203 RepID=A0A9Q3BXT4_9BASI|nr:hypothetical protein [Austropuccinia psidii MF-1]